MKSVVSFIVIAAMVAIEWYTITIQMVVDIDFSNMFMISWLPKIKFINFSYSTSASASADG